MRSTFWMYEPSGLPGWRPSFWNCWVRYATAFSSPGVPGARPSIESAARSLMCWSSDAVSIACAAAATAGNVAVVSVNAAELDVGFDESADALAPVFSVTHPASRKATRRLQVRRMESTGEGIGCLLGWRRRTLGAGAADAIRNLPSTEAGGKRHGTSYCVARHSTTDHDR